MNHRIAILILTLITGLTACQQNETSSSEEQAQPKAVPAAMTEEIIVLSKEQMNLAGVQLGRPQMRTLSNYIECTGMVDVPPSNRISIYSPVEGFVEKVKHLPGEYVRKGAVLTTITHPSLVRLQREFLEVTSQLDALKSDYQRKDTLAGSEATSQRELEKAKAAYEMQLARYRGIKAELDLIGIDTDKLEKKGEIQSRIVLRAPVSGYMDKVLVNTGMLVGSSDMLYQMLDDQHIHLELRVYAKDLNRLRKGQRVEARLPGREEILPAEIYLIGKMIDMETKTALVHSHFLDETAQVTPGAFVHAHIFIDREEVRTVPTSAVVREGDEAFVFVEKGKGFRKTPVTLGKTGEDYMEIRGLQLEAGQRIATHGAYYINGSMGEE